MRRVRIAYLQKAPSGHADACLRALASEAEIFVTMPPTLADAPYDPDAFGWLPNTYPLASLHRDDGLVRALERFEPDVVLTVGWEQPAYRRCARALRGSALRVVGMDNQWLGTRKQRLGVATSRLYLRPYFDAAFLPGPRQKNFALRLGFAPDRIFEGFYSADIDSFQGVPSLADTDGGRRNRFVYVGRLVDSKGINELLDAYEAYRASVVDPWGLLVAGSGPLVKRLSGRPGIEAIGFVEPEHLADCLARASFLVLPSKFEPWGVVVHEATAAGLGCICTAAVGAADAFVRDRENGRVVKPGSSAELASALRWAHELGPPERAAVSAVSRSLAATITPERWATTILEMAGRGDVRSQGDDGPARHMVRSTGADAADGLL